MSSLTRPTPAAEPSRRKKTCTAWPKPTRPSPITGGRVSGFVLTNPELKRVSGFVLTNPELKRVSGFVLTNPELKRVSGFVLTNPELKRVSGFQGLCLQALG